MLQNREAIIVWKHQNGEERIRFGAERDGRGKRGEGDPGPDSRKLFAM